jgi:hypothetical protein
MIPNFTIYSDKVNLTANYYIEYLGFNLLYKVEDVENPYVWLEFNNQFLLIWPWNNKLGIARPAVFEVADICEWFFEMQQRTRINVPLFKKDGKYNFSILDCEGNVIHFNEQPSQTFTFDEDLNSMDLAVEAKNS